MGGDIHDADAGSDGSELTAAPPTTDDSVALFGGGGESDEEPEEKPEETEPVVTTTREEAPVVAKQEAVIAQAQSEVTSSAQEHFPLQVNHTFQIFTEGWLYRLFFGQQTPNGDDGFTFYVATQDELEIFEELVATDSLYAQSGRQKLLLVGKQLKFARVQVHQLYFKLTAKIDARKKDEDDQVEAQRKAEEDARLQRKAAEAQLKLEDELRQDLGEARDQIADLERDLTEAQNQKPVKQRTSIGEWVGLTGLGLVIMFALEELAIWKLGVSLLQWIKTAF
ncbi:hypothetical protein HN958_03905 [Candidatus Falkowbacteria bacterium]|nr:hypothetical protein [Candidatus Falkowbacteria bacterium]